MASITLSDQLRERLDAFQAVQSDDIVKTDLELTCLRCGEVVCDVEHQDTLLILVDTALTHVCELLAIDDDITIEPGGMVCSDDAGKCIECGEVLCRDEHGTLIDSTRGAVCGVASAGTAGENLPHRAADLPRLQLVAAQVVNEFHDDDLTTDAVAALAELLPAHRTEEAARLAGAELSREARECRR